MQTIDDTLNLLRRQADLESAMKQPGGIRITEEQELHFVRRQLRQYPEAVRAVLQAAHALSKPVSNLSATDVEGWVSHEQVA
jgi:hypothetical protein